jgi:decaprenylphospho-beta-D-erythro-pentofuranosid-2-ulose 2-reductase
VKDGLGDVQSVLVLGGGSDIALAIVRALVVRRCRTVVLAARRPHELAGVAAEIRAIGATTVETVAFDADRTEDHPAVIGAAFERHRDLDVVVVAFGVLGDQGEIDADPALGVAVARTNFVGAVSAGLVAADRLRRQGHGTLVVLSSVAGQRVRKANFVYGSTKAGVDAFAQGLGDALAPDGIHVLVVRPGFVATKMTAGRPRAPLATDPEAVARAVVAGIAAGKDVVWAPPVLRYVFTVLRHTPRWAWRRLPDPTDAS